MSLFSNCAAVSKTAQIYYISLPPFRILSWKVCFSILRNLPGVIIDRLFAAGKQKFCQQCRIPLIQIMSLQHLKICTYVWTQFGAILWDAITLKNFPRNQRFSNPPFLKRWFDVKKIYCHIMQIGEVCKNRQLRVVVVIPFLFWQNWFQVNFFIAN